jgi:hypothetical protein
VQFYLSIKRIFAYSFTLVCFGLVAINSNAADFTVDGCFECGSEDYQLGYEVLFNFDDGTVGDGALYFGQDDDGIQYLFFKMAEDYVDTIYSDDKNDTDVSDAGWDLNNARDFKTILLSDKLGNSAADAPLVFHTNNNGTVELQVDLLACVESSGNCGGQTWDNNNVDYESGGYEITGYGKSDGDIISGTPGDFILEIESSMGYNAGLDGFNVNKSLTTAQGWQNYVGYEFAFKAGTFTNWITPGQDIASFLDLGESHASPPKKVLDTTTTGECIEGCTPVPEPNTLALFSLALFGGLYSRRKLK